MIALEFNGEQIRQNSSPFVISSQQIARPAARWYGGKWSLAKWIIPHFPFHQIYVEPFGGMFSCGLQKLAVGAEIYNDLYGEAYNFWIQLRDNPKKLISLIEKTAFTKESYQWCKTPGTDKIENAVKFYGQCLISYCGGGVLYSGGTSSDRLSRSELKDCSHLWAISDRVKNLNIYNQNAFDIIQNFDSPHTLFYVDPPYLWETKNSHTPYVHELNKTQHVQLIELLLSVKGKVVLSGYSHEIYDARLLNWERKEKEATTTSRKKKIEILWIKN